jgi:hypothetical protein
MVPVAGGMLIPQLLPAGAAEEDPRAYIDAGDFVEVAHAAHPARKVAQLKLCICIKGEQEGPGHWVGTTVKFMSDAEQEWRIRSGFSLASPAKSVALDRNAAASVEGRRGWRCSISRP